jgi:hypothetical protein
MLNEIHGTTGGWDERGLVTVVVPHVASKFSDVFATVPPPIAGLAETGRTWTHDAGATFRVDVTFEGGGPGGSGSRSEGPTYSCNSSFREEPIEAHPQIEELKRLYNGQTDVSTGKVTFPATLEGAAGENGLAGEEGIAAETRNPMAGVEKYMALDVVWEKKYVSGKRPNFKRVGRLTTNPPGSAPSIAGRSAWLILPPNFVKRGNVYEVTEQWQLLPEGTPVEVYNLGGPAETAE